MLSSKHSQETFRHVLEIRNLQREIRDRRRRIAELVAGYGTRLKKILLSQEIKLRRVKIEKHLTEAYSRLGVPKSRTEVVLMVTSDGFVSPDALLELDSLEGVGMIWSILSPCPECGERYLDNNSEDICVCVTGQDCVSCSDADRWECSSCGAVFEYSYETHRFELNSVPDSEEDNP